MLRTMREKSAVLMVILIIAFIGTIIFSWGMGGLGTIDQRGKGMIAKVNGEDITYNYFRNIEQNLIKQKQQQTQEITDVDMAKIRIDAWDQMLQAVVIDQQKIKQNIIVSDDQIVREIRENPLADFKSNPQFMTDNKFDLKKYQEFVDNPEPQMEALFRQLEDIYRDRIWRTILQDKVASGAVVTENEIRDEYLSKNIKAKVKFLKVQTNEFRPADSTITNAQLEKYYNENIAEFPVKKEERIFDYVLFSTEPTAKDSAMVLEDINYALDQVNNGMKFSEAAGNYSEDATRDKGGELGWFGRDRMDPAFEKAAFNGKKGDLVGPVKSKFGYHLIKIEDKKVKDGKVTEVKASHILTKFKAYPSTKEDARYLALNFQDDLRSNGYDSKGFALALKNSGKKLLTSEPTFNGTYSQNIGKIPALKENLFEQKVGAVSPMLTTDKGFIFLIVKSIDAERKKTVKELESTLKSKVKNQIAIDKAFSFLKTRAVELKDTTYFKLVADSDTRFEIGYTKEFPRSGYIAKIGRDDIFANLAFSMKVGTISEPFKGKSNPFVIYLVSRTEFDQADYDKKKEGIRTTLQTTLEQSIIKSWIEGVVESAIVEDYRDLYNR